MPKQKHHIRLSALACGCLARRIPDRPTLARELHARERDRNLTTRSIRWQFTPTTARSKLRKLHPSFEDSRGTGYLTVWTIGKI